MMQQRWAVVAVLGAVLLGACGGEPEEPTPVVTAPDTAAERRAREAAAAEAARRAEAERMERERAARDRAMEEARRARETIAQRVHFDFDQSAIRPSAEETLRRQVGVLRAHPNVRLRITGHADERGSTEYNLALGQRRAQAVKDFYTTSGLAASRFEVNSLGEERPLVRESNEAAWAQNRRAEFTIIAGESTLNP
ncbi:MAG TPA: OmpA family protein [Longimicrobiales bacterium]|nr:OmpA family protein [Longimicrobiales bacterium]